MRILVAVVSAAVVSCFQGHSCAIGAESTTRDTLRDLQSKATASNRSSVAYWGTDPHNYMGWGTHTNRLIPVYTFGTAGGGPGIDLRDYLGPRSIYRSAEHIRGLYGALPVGTLNPDADYCDQTDIARLQEAALLAGRKYVFLFVFDGMDWETTRSAAIYQSRHVSYDAGRGSGLHFQDYTAHGTTQFGFMVTSPHNSGTEIDVDRQSVTNPSGERGGGYNADRGGPTPWTHGSNPDYLISKNTHDPICHAYTDSASSATSMNAGIKTYNGAVNVDWTGRKFLTTAHQAQADGYSVGAVTSVPISHATPAATYAHNVHRDDYQDLTRDLLGLPSVSHPDRPLPGLDVLIGCGHGVDATENKLQGSNFVPGNIYLTDADRHSIDHRNGGKYVVSERTAGVNGGERLKQFAAEAATDGHRLLGFYGTADSKLPFATADGDFQPAPGRAKPESYTPADIAENPTLAEMTASAIAVLETNPKGFWLMIEAGDVDWANHDNNLDNSIGAVLSGDAAVKVATDWVEQNSNWQESILIVTADHGHYLVLERPEALIPHPDGSAIDAD